MESQFALMEYRGAHYIIDAAEMAALERHADAIQDSARLQADESLRIAYGVFLPQPHLTPEAALAHALGSKGYRLGHIDDQHCRPIQLIDIRVFGVQRPRLKSVRIPFAALIRVDSHVGLKISAGQAQFLSAFVRYDNVSPADNILNRRGVFAFSVPTPRFNLHIQEESWGCFVNRNVAVEISKKLK